MQQDVVLVITNIILGTMLILSGLIGNTHPMRGFFISILLCIMPIALLTKLMLTGDSSNAMAYYIILIYILFFTPIVILTLSIIYTALSTITKKQTPKLSKNWRYLFIFIGFGSIFIVLRYYGIYFLIVYYKQLITYIFL